MRKIFLFLLFVIYYVNTNGQIILSQDTNFNAWYYKNDASHIAFYNQKSLVYFADYLVLEINHFSERVIFLKRI